MNPSKAELFMDGSACYYTADNDIPQILENGWCALHDFVRDYPHIKIYLGEYFQSKRPIPKNDLPFLLQHILKKKRKD